jgi:hypothetical protein
MNRPLSLKDFKNWLAGQQGMSNFFNIEKDALDEVIGKPVKSKVSQKKMLEKIETTDDAEALIEEFIKNGGTVLSIEGKMVNIEVESGEFSLPRFCVKIKS